MNETTSDSVRNVLFIMCDQLRLDALSCFGGTVIETPNIDRLAARGCDSIRPTYRVGLWLITHELLHRSLCAVSWRPLQPDSAVDRATHAWRSPPSQGVERC